jgi:formamidopyrimidine-DNA glycosylase
LRSNVPQKEVKESLMPELPDLQVFSKNLQKQLAGKKLEKVIVTKGYRINAGPKQLTSRVTGQKLKAVYREGKELRMQFSNGALLGLHMMLRGRLQWFEDEPPRHVLFQMIFEKEKKLALTDYQRKARVTLDPDPSGVPDALSKDLNLAYLREQLQSRATIKNLLTDQKVIRGIGNAYADEILWEAGISPFSISKNIPAPKIKTLAKAITSVLKNAEKQIAKSDPDIIGGEIRDFLKIHNASQEKSPRGGKIIHKEAGGRKTYYTEEQEEY